MGPGGHRKGKKAASQQDADRAGPQQTWVCIATGPSLSAADCEKVRHLNCITVNDAYRLAPWAAAHYAADAEWWRVHIGAMDHCSGQKTTQHRNWQPGEAEKHGITVLKSSPKPGLSRDAGTLHAGRNSGYQAINLAYLLGATRILLLGYDMGATGNTHFFGDHPKALRQCSDYGKFRAPFRTIHPADYGLEIINCTRQTALDAFPRMDLEAALENL